MRNFYNLTLALSILGIPLSLISLIPGIHHPEPFAWLIIYMPVLWTMWIVCALSPKWEPTLKELWILWACIDLAVLALFISLSLTTDHWLHAKGADVVVFVTYFPVIIPLGLVFSLLPEQVTNAPELLASLFGGRAGEGIAGWIFFSIIALMQSWVIARISQKRRFRRETLSRNPVQ